MKRLTRKMFFPFIFLTLLAALSACTSSPTFEVYKGDSLSIGVIGESPKVNEEQVRFTEISFAEMTSKDLKSYDAVFIRENNLSEASKSQYADIYANSSIPFFFIGTDNFLPFTEKDLEYDKTSYWTPGTSYTVGVLTSQEDNTLKSWKYGLYNGKKTDEHIKEMYSNIFKTIDEVNQ